jgi:hypothetical protein
MLAQRGYYYLHPATSDVKCRSTQLAWGSLNCRVYSAPDWGIVVLQTPRDKHPTVN